MPEHILEGCRPTPLASYLKALGILRLVAEQKDPAARGWWQADRFHLRTALDRDGLMRFFLEEYRPTPIIAPWNGRAGFLEGEGDSSEDNGENQATEEGVDGSEQDNAEDDNEGSTRIGAQLRRAYEATAAERFQALRKAVQSYSSLAVMAEMDSARSGWKKIEREAKGRRKTPDEAAEFARLKKVERSAKDRLLDAIRSHVAENELAWLDASLRTHEERSGDRVKRGRSDAPLLIKGGSDGSRDIGVGFGSALQALFAIESGIARKEAKEWFASSLFDEAAILGTRGTFGHLNPALGGYNATTGYDGDKSFFVNPWDRVLALEGAVLWAGGVTRRLGAGAEKSAASFPFSFEMTRAGAGQLSAPDRNGAPGEVWCPLWGRPTGLKELKALFREGRLTLGRRPARTGLEAALAVQMLGRSRGIPAFVRVGLYQSDAKMPHTAAPLGRHLVGAAPDAAALGRELAEHPWLALLRSAAREAPATLLATVRALDDSLFALAARPPGGERKRVDAKAAQAVLIALGRAGRLIAVRPKLHESLPPPPRLSADWIAAADDGSPEFRLALALAGLRMVREVMQGEAGTVANAVAERDNVADDDAAGTGDSEGGAQSDNDAPVGAARQTVDLAMCAHLGPLDPDSPLHSPRWAGNAKRAGEGRALAVWGAGSLIDNLCAVAQRRLIEQRRRGLAQVPFDGAYGASGGDLRAFLDGAVDDAHIADLLLGLAWVRRKHPASKGESAPPPFAYAALKPLFTPRRVLERLNEERRRADREHRLPYDVPDLPLPPALPSLLAAGRVAEAVRLGQQRAQASGLPTPFLDPRSRTDGRPSDVAFGRRLLAALVIPVADRVVEACLKRAYPADGREPVDSFMEESHDAA